MARTTKKKVDPEYVGGLVHCLEDLEHTFTGVFMNEIRKMYLQGKSPEVIGKKMKRDPDEIFLALFHMARQGMIKRPFATRL